MHMSDALVSPTVAIATGLISATLIAVSIKKIKENNSDCGCSIIDCRTDCSGRCAGTKEKRGRGSSKEN